MKTDNTSKHTPTPWKINRGVIVHEKPNPAYPVNSDYALVCRVIGKITDVGPEQENQANAAFIVKACNEYESLTDKVRELNDLNAD